MKPAGRAARIIEAALRETHSAHAVAVEDGNEIFVSGVDLPGVPWRVTQRHVRRAFELASQRVMGDPDHFEGRWAVESLGPGEWEVGDD